MHDTAVLGGGGMAEQSSAVLGGGGMAEHEIAVAGGGGMAEQSIAVLGGGGITEHDTAFASNSIPLCCAARAPASSPGFGPLSPRISVSRPNRQPTKMQNGCPAGSA